MKHTIKGGSLPAVIINLEPGESIISQAGGRTWFKGEVVTDTRSMGGTSRALGRMFTGERLFMSHYTAKSPAEIAFSSSFPGTIIERKLERGESVIAQKSAFLCATPEVELAVHFQKKLGAGFFGGEGFVMQKITGPGTVFLEIDGYCQEYDLAQGEKLVCDTGVLALMDATCDMDIERIKGMKNVLFGGEGFFDTVITGPGKVYLQTMTIPKLASLMRPFLPSNK